MKTGRCFFIGHTDTPEDIYPGLSSAIERQITQNSVTEFYVGNHGRFDVLAYRALRVAKRKYPYIRCYLVLAYHPGTVHVAPPVDFNGIFYPLVKSVPARYTIPRANRAMVDFCDVLIAAVNRPGRSREVLLHAQRRETQGLIQIINLADT